MSDPPPGPAMRAAAERGRLFHALFERLPPVEPQHRAGCADRWLATAGGVADAAERQRIVAGVLAVIENPAYAPLFGPTALPRRRSPRRSPTAWSVSGTVDRC